MALKRIRTAFVLIPVLLAGLSVGPASASPTVRPAADDPVVARIDDTQIRRSDLMIALRLLPAQYRKMPLEAVYPLVLRQVINNTLIVRAGRSEGLEKLESIRQRLQDIERRLVGEAYMEQALRGKVTDQAMRERYRNVTESLRGNEELRVRHILVKNKSEAASIIAKLSEGANFAEMARENSMGPSTARSGDLGYLGRDFADVAFGLKIGRVTPMPIETRFGWHVIKLEDRRALRTPSFEEMRPQLARQIRARIAFDTVKQLKRNANIVEFDINGKPKPTSASQSLPSGNR